MEQKNKETSLETPVSPSPAQPPGSVPVGRCRVPSKEWELNVPELISNFPLHLPLPAASPPAICRLGASGLCTDSPGPARGWCFTALELGLLSLPTEMSRALWVGEFGP